MRVALLDAPIPLRWFHAPTRVVLDTLGKRWTPSRTRWILGPCCGDKRHRNRADLHRKFGVSLTRHTHRHGWPLLQGVRAVRMIARGLSSWHTRVLMQPEIRCYQRRTLPWSPFYETWSQNTGLKRVCRKLVPNYFTSYSLDACVGFGSNATHEPDPREN